MLRSSKVILAWSLGTLGFARSKVLGCLFNLRDLRRHVFVGCTALHQDRLHIQAGEVACVPWADYQATGWNRGWLSLVPNMGVVELTQTVQSCSHDIHAGLKGRVAGHVLVGVLEETSVVVTTKKKIVASDIVELQVRFL